jgi:hypothetical protein
LLAAFNAHSVKYVVVGGYAVFVHAQPRATKDLDVLIESSPANALATYKALADFGARSLNSPSKTLPTERRSPASATRPSASMYCRE